METESQPQGSLLSPSADPSKEQQSLLKIAPSSTAEVTPGDGAFSPHNDGDANNKDGASQHEEGGGEDDVGFGPPPAFPSSSSKALGKRKRTIMSVSTTGGAPLEDESSSEDGEKKPNSNSQMIHRIKKNVQVESPQGNVLGNDEGEARKYSDAMLLASLSDVESPKIKNFEFADANNATATASVQQESGERGSTPKTKEPSSSVANTPQRSNVNTNPISTSTVEPIKPFALMPKPGPGLSSPNKRQNTGSAQPSPDGRDPKSAKSKNEKVAREGVYAHHPQAPPQYYPGYPYPPYPHPHAPPPPHHASAYPPMSYAPYPHHQGPPPGMASTAGPYHPRPYYPPTAHAGTPERWGTYHSPKYQDHKAPEPVRSNNESSPPYHPLTRTSSSKSSHLVPSEDGDAGAAGMYGRPHPGPYGPPPPGMASYPPDSRYSGPPPPARDEYGQEYNTISRDDGSPPRNTPPRPSRHAHPPKEYSPAVDTPPRGHQYDYYEQSAPGSHGSYPPSQGYNPDSPARSAYPPHPSYAGGDPYEPSYDYASTSPPEAHYHVPAAVSNETEHLGQPPSPPSSNNKYHQFRKGGRSIHSEPIILRKKFSWRNYPELEEYLIANRTDYLRHSALNYTAEQKHFNNRLTEGLLELAAKLNYVFDESCFNFVAVRDRIRCYYKSFVQSSKKRGVVVGYSKQQDGNLVKKEDLLPGQAGQA